MEGRMKSKFGAIGILAVVVSAIPLDAASTQPIMELSGLDHFAVNVKDLDRSTKWYQDVFGFSVLKKWNTTTMVGRGNMKVGLFYRPKASNVSDIDNTIVISHVAFLIDGDKFNEALARIKKWGFRWTDLKTLGSRIP